MENLTERKLYMLELMKKVHGVHYTLGWVSQSWVNPNTVEVEEEIVEQTIERLEEAAEQQDRAAKNEQ